MELFKYRGKRIRPRDQYLLYDFTLLSLCPLFLITVLLFHLPGLMDAGWDIPAYAQHLNKVYLAGSFLTALFLCLTAVVLFFRYCKNYLRQLLHRQKLARMILDNHWYESEVRTTESETGTKSKTVITYFPRLYYRMKGGFITVTIETAMGRYQKIFVNLENKLESGLFCELHTKELKENFIEYTMICDLIADRILIDDITVENGSMKLMKNIDWAFDKLPNMLISGGVGSGKSYLLLMVIKALCGANTVLYILDPKNADLADLGAVLPNVYHEPEAMISCIESFKTAMFARSKEMKNHPDYQTGMNYAALGLPAHFLIFDEYVAFMDLLGRDSAPVMANLKQIILMGRQLGFFVILACQRPDAKYLVDGMRDQFNFRVALGRVSDTGYDMMFGQQNKEYFLKTIKGRGYVDYGEGVISEFYSPLVPPGYDFLAEISKTLTGTPGKASAAKRKAVSLDKGCAGGSGGEAAASSSAPRI